MFGMIYGGATPNETARHEFITATRKSAESIRDQRKFAIEMMKAFEQLNNEPFMYFGESGKKSVWRVTQIGERAQATLKIVQTSLSETTADSTPSTTIALQRVNGSWLISSLFNEDDETVLDTNDPSAPAVDTPTFDPPIPDMTVE